MPQAQRHLLFVYPDFDPTYWGMQYSLPLVGRKSFMPPLGLLTIAALTPAHYEIRIVDMNCGPLNDRDLDWADIVLFSAMMMQQRSLFAAAQRCRSRHKTVVFGGPYPTSFTDECAPYCDHLVLNEGEITWPLFLRDLEAGALQPVYASTAKPDITASPCPRFDLVRLNDYAVIPLQYSRGCPFQCEFCDIVILYGRVPRTKTPAQMLAELDAVYATGYRGGIFIVDDNFIGNKRETLKLLTAMQGWNRSHRHPFQYGTEASLNLAEDPALLQALVEAGFLWAFIGIETPSAEALKRANKFQNVRGSLQDRVRVLQTAGLLVFGGFILGFDSDTPDIFDRQLEFIREAAIPNALIGQLGALPGTPLHARLEREDRLLGSLTVEGGLGPFYSNFRTSLSFETIVRGQARMLRELYRPRAYFDRLLEAYRRLPRKSHRLHRLLSSGGILLGGVKLLFLVRMLCLVEAEYRREAFRFLRRMLRESPEYLQQSFDYLVMAYHYYRFTRDTVLPELESVADSERLRQGGNEPASVRVSGRGEYALHRTALHDLSLMQDGEPVAQSGDRRQVV